MSFVWIYSESQQEATPRKGGDGLRSRPVQGDPQQEALPRTGGDATTSQPHLRPLSEMTQLETRGGRILLFEPERLDAWIGRGIEKDHATGRYLDLSTGKPLSKKDATSYEAYHTRRLRRSRLRDRVDRYIRLVDKYVPKVSEEARVYIARFPHKVGEVLKQVRKIRKKIRKNRNKQRHRTTLRPTRTSTTPGLPLRLYPGENKQESLRRKCSEALRAMLTGNSSMIHLQTGGEAVQRRKPNNQTPIHGRGEKLVAHRTVEKALECWQKNLGNLPGTHCRGTAAFPEAQMTPEGECS